MLWRIVKWGSLVEVYLVEGETEQEAWIGSFKSWRHRHNNWKIWQVEKLYNDWLMKN